LLQMAEIRGACRHPGSLPHGAGITWTRRSRSINAGHMASFRIPKHALAVCSSGVPRWRASCLRSALASRGRHLSLTDLRVVDRGGDVAAARRDAVLLAHRSQALHRQAGGTRLLGLLRDVRDGMGRRRRRDEVGRWDLARRLGLRRWQGRVNRRLRGVGGGQRQGRLHRRD
jgi:hypothetical protein